MVISSDGSGNHYIGVDDDNLSTLAIASGEISQLLDNAMGAGNYALRAGAGKYHVNWRPAAVVGEVFTSTIGSVANDYPDNNSPADYARFAHPYAISTNFSLWHFYAINCNDTDSLTNNSIRSAGTLNALTPDIDAGMQCRITATNRSLASYVFNPASGYRCLIWTGILSDSVAPYDTYPIAAAAIVIADDGVGGSIQEIIRVASPNGTAAQNILTSGDANYPVTCSNASTPVPGQATDLFLRDDNAPNNNPTAGRCNTLLLAKDGTQILNETYQVGSDLQTIEPGSDLYRCVGYMGTDAILMRVAQT